MPDNVRSTLRRVDRVTRFNRQRPAAPRDVAFQDGVLSWKPPPEITGVTHYRIYKNSDDNLVREVPVGQNQIEDNLVADRVMVSAWNESLKLESGRIPLTASVFPEDPYPAVPDDATPGEEWTSSVTGLTATVEYGVDQIGGLFWRVYGTFSEPSDPTYYGVRIVGRYAGNDVQLAVEPRGSGAYISTWYSVPESPEAWTIYATSFGSNYKPNTIVPGTTPSANVTIQDQAGLGGLKLNRVDGGTFNSAEFEIDPTEGFQMSIINADKIQTGILKVGGGGSKPGQLGVFDALNSMVAWAGQNGAYYGIWGKQLWVGGTDPSNAPLYVDSGGNVVMESVGAYDPTLKLVKNGVTTELLHNINHAEGGYGVRVYDATYEHRISPYFVGLYKSSSPRVKITSNVTAGGSVSVQDSSGSGTASMSHTGIKTFNSLAIQASGDLQATNGALRIGALGTTVIDNSRNILNVGNVTISGYLDSASYIDAATAFRLNSTTVIDSSRNLTNIASATLSSYLDAASYIDGAGGFRVNGTEVVDSGANIISGSADYLKVHNLRVTNYAVSGSPASAATHKVPVYDGNGTLLNYLYLYP